MVWQDFFLNIRTYREVRHGTTEQNSDLAQQQKNNITVQT